MIFNYWKNVMGFAFAPLYIKSSFVKKIAPIALPVIGGAIAGPLGFSVAAGAAAGGAIGGLVSGGGLEGALIGGITGYAGAKFATGLGGSGLFGGGASGISNAPSSLVMGGSGVGITGRTIASGGLISRAGMSIGQNLTGVNKLQSLLGQRSAAMGSRAVTSPLTQPGGGGLFGDLGSKIFGEHQPGGQGTVSQNIGGGQSKFLGFDRGKIEEMVGAGFSAYEGDIRQQQIDALQQNLGQYQDEFAGHYATEAKKHEDALARGELPATYTAALEREKDRLTRLMIAQGHNPAEAGKGAEEVVRGTMDLESQFINQERNYWRAVSGGADTMTARIAQLKQEQANELRAKETTLGELGTSVVGGLLGNKPKGSGGINISLESLQELT
jgi:hypothetical protein